jgi:hypothetical protein
MGHEQSWFGKNGIEDSGSSRALASQTGDEGKLHCSSIYLLAGLIACKPKRRNTLINFESGRASKFRKLHG